MTSSRDHIRAFLEIFDHQASEAELDLWMVVLERAGGNLLEALAVWLEGGTRKPTPAEVRNLLWAQQTGSKLRSICIETAANYGLTEDILKGPDKTKGVSQVRQEVMYLMRQAGISYQQIGRYFNRDHTTILHGERAHAKRSAGVGKLEGSTLSGASQAKPLPGNAPSQGEDA